MTDNNMGLAGDNAIDTSTNPATVYGTSRYLDLGEDKEYDSSDIVRFTATKKYTIKNISITQDRSAAYTYAYSVWKTSHATSLFSQDSSDIIDMRSENDNPDTDFNESKIQYTRIFRPGDQPNLAGGKISKNFDLSGYTLDVGDSLYVRTTNNIPAGGSESVNACVKIVLTPTA